ncbi:NAD(P)-binding domain-containing protein [Paenibacillus sp. y28]|uniref:NAD(P)-binding domain-containing protein n=1 Tax=Paenibacillus sp. y28 TaxID=3129110 RepID=UPI0030199C77
MKTIAFIGLGVMGLPMARNLLKNGFEVTVYNRTAAKAEELVSMGAKIAATPADAARSSQLLMTMLSNDDSLLDVFHREQGIMEGLHPGLTIIDSSTVAPQTSQQLYRELQAHYVDFLDAPVTGSKPAAESGTLLFMVGGDREVLEDNEVYLQAMGRKVIYMGPSGSGSYAKLAHNTIVGINALALCEGMSMAAKAGLDPVDFLEIVQSGGAASKQAELKGEKMINRDFSTQFSLELMHKDLRLASILNSGMGVTTPLLNLAQNIFSMGFTKSNPADDLCGVIQCYEEWMGARVEQAAAKVNSSYPSNVTDRRRNMRVTLNIQLQLSVYQWEKEGAFSGQNIDGVLHDLSESGIQIASTFPLAKDMFIVIHFPSEAELPPITAKIIRIESEADGFHYGCIIAGLPPVYRSKLEQYIALHLEQLA